jgi:integrase/recombinase XerD
MGLSGKYGQLKKKYSGILKGFEKYLQKRGYELNTMRQFKNYTAFFLDWKEKKSIEESQVTYNDLLVYIDYCRQQENSTKLVNRKLASIRKYYEYLQSKGEALNNPASGLFLKGKRKSVPNNLLDEKELRELYNNYQTYDLRTARNKIILSLLINQAVTTDELHKLEPGHIKLKAGKIEIPGGKHRNGRTLKLEASQVIELQEYLNETRPAILKALSEVPKWSGRKAEKPDFKRLENQLIISVNGSTIIKNSQYHLIRALQQINPKVRNCQQIRQSVITEWLKHEGVRIVQYKAGHRYVSTTERYQSNNLEDLQEALNQHYPLK